MPKKILLEMRNINKRFGAVVAIDNVDFEIYEGEILGLLGDNGAGKSTLIKIISGALKEDSGEIFFKGEKLNIRNPRDAIDLGIETIYQDLSLYDNLEFSMNIFAGREYVKQGLGRIFGYVDVSRMRMESGKVLEGMSINMPREREVVEKFSGGQRQAIAIARAAFWGKKMLLMDEPTAALGVRESGNVLALIKEFIKRVKGIVIITHNIDHIINVADRAIILRRGKRAGSVEFKKYKGKSEELHNEIVKIITGFESISNNQVT